MYSMLTQSARTMTYRQEIASWLSPPPVATAPSPSIGSHPPSTPELPFPSNNNKPAVIAFLRHCGCPFAEKTFLRLRSSASAHPDITFIAVSHSDQPSTDKWLEAVGGAGPIQMVVDLGRKVYAAWGLGTLGFWDVLNPAGPWSVYKLGKEEGIWNRPTETGSRWQSSGAFAVDGSGFIRWGQAAPSADWIPDFEEAVNAVGG